MACSGRNDLDRLGMRSVISVGRVLHVAAGIADAGGDDAGLLADQVLHAPETASGEDCAFCRHGELLWMMLRGQYSAGS